MTFINARDIFADIATRHRQINSFGFGVLADVASSGDVNYTLMWIEADGSVARKGEVGYKFRVLVMDIIKKGKENEVDVLNDTHQIMLDVLAELNRAGNAQTYPLRLKQNETSLNYFIERFDEEVGGWEMVVTLWGRWDWDKCAIPFTGETTLALLAEDENMLILE
mgnify:CR=1 FL=1